MSTETGAEERRLSRSNSESEKDAHEEASHVDTNCQLISNATSEVDVEKKQAQHFVGKDRNLDGSSTLGKTKEGKETLETQTGINRNDVTPGDGSRQIIAVSANKNPTAFFQLARKFLMTNEMCDLSALEGAIVSAVDAAHLLERSKLASIVRIHTSYVNVEPKRRRQVSYQRGEVISESIVEGTTTTTAKTDAFPSLEGELPSSKSNVAGVTTTMDDPSQTPSLSSSSISASKKIMMSAAQQTGQRYTSASSNRNLTSPSGGSRELRRARILVTVKRTESYKRWLEENPSQRQAIIAGTANMTAEDIVGGDSSNKASSIT